MGIRPSETERFPSQRSREREKWARKQCRWRNRRKFDTKSHSGPFIYRQSARALESFVSLLLCQKRAPLRPGVIVLRIGLQVAEKKVALTRSLAKTHREAGTNAWWSGPAVSAKSWLSLERPSRRARTPHENTMPLFSYYYFISKSINRSLNRHSSAASAPNIGEFLGLGSRRQWLTSPKWASVPLHSSALCCSWAAAIAADGGLVTMLWRRDTEFPKWNLRVLVLLLAFRSLSRALPQS